MSNYRRLISYIYAYEGGVKGKNIGFAKLEARNGQCKISVNVKKVYVGSNDLGVYLLAGSSEILLGKIFIRSGAGEFRTTIQVANVENSGINMDLCYGITIHDVKGGWQSYTTIWEDAVAHAAEVELADITAENQRKQDIKTEQQVSKISEENTTTAETQIQESEAAENKIEKGAVKDCSEAIEKIFGIGTEESEEIKKGANAGVNAGAEVSAGAEVNVGVSAGAGVNAGLEASAGAATESTLVTGTDKKVRPETTNPLQRLFQAGVLGHQGQGRREVPGCQAIQQSKVVFQSTESERKIEAEEDHVQLWEELRKKYPKMLAFDYENGCEILSIKPQDIGQLPREIWAYGNNSFLLHGYYNYRYLILVKLNQPMGEARYLLGVPGHYYSNEKYMAAMFGFPEFVLAKNQPIENGYFGYWHTDIKLGHS